MGSLQEQLDEIHRNFESSAPSDALEVMHRATDELVDSGLAERAAGSGDTFPDFALTGADGTPFASQEVFGSKPVIVNFFRGFW
ncbi:MAG: hypothetical protein AAF236_02120 [Verrucomicrobiota bacterium]